MEHLTVNDSSNSTMHNVYSEIWSLNVFHIIIFHVYLHVTQRDDFFGNTVFWWGGHVTRLHHMICYTELLGSSLGTVWKKCERCPKILAVWLDELNWTTPVAYAAARWKSLKVINPGRCLAQLVEQPPMYKGFESDFESNCSTAALQNSKVQ